MSFPLVASVVSWQTLIATRNALLSSELGLYAIALAGELTLAALGIWIAYEHRGLYRRADALDREQMLESLRMRLRRTTLTFMVLTFGSSVVASGAEVLTFGLGTSQRLFVVGVTLGIGSLCSVFGAFIYWLAFRFVTR